MLDAYATPLKTSSQAVRTSITLPGLYLCFVALNVNDTKQSPPSMVVFPDPRLKMRQFYGVTNSFFAGLVNYDCCSSSDIDFFGSCFLQNKACPVKVSFQTGYVSTYNGWKVQFDCFRYEAGLVANVRLLLSPPLFFFFFFFLLCLLVLS
jgi:hypothetical protein